MYIYITWHSISCSSPKSRGVITVYSGVLCAAHIYAYVSAALSTRPRRRRSVCSNPLYGYRQAYSILYFSLNNLQFFKIWFQEFSNILEGHVLKLLRNVALYVRRHTFPFFSNTNRFSMKTIWWIYQCLSNRLLFRVKICT